MSTFTARRFDTNEPVRVHLRHNFIESVIPVSLPESETEALPVVGPGLVDIQVNGFNGIWFSSEQLTVDEVEQVIHAYMERGITRCLPTLITNSCEALEHGLSTIRLAREKSSLVRHAVVGCHVEGPFISPLDGPRGAHPLVHVRPPSLTEFGRWQRAAGNLVRMVTLAPEVPGALKFTEAISKAGVIVSIGHTAASTDMIRQAVDHGATLGTHLGNGCAAMIPRHDNIFWPQLADDRLTCSVISDGWHVPATMLNCILRCKTLGRVILTSDVSGFGGCGPGQYKAGEVTVDILPDGRIVVAGQTQFLAGSGATTGECVVHLTRACDLTLADAWPLASTQPAKLLGIAAGELQEGGVANLTVFRLAKTWCPANGTEIVKFQPEFSVISGVILQSA